MSNELIEATPTQLDKWDGAAARGLHAREERQQIIESVLVADVDYGVIPGTEKPCLLKSGAEKVADALNLYAAYEPLVQTEDWDKPLFYYRYRCELRQRGSDTTISTGIGSCNSMESRYRWRQAERVCPSCGKNAIIKGKEEYGGGWLCLMPDTPVLYADMTWRPIGQARVGDAIIGFDEYPMEGSQRRKLRPSTIEALWWNRKPTVRLITDSGEIRTTADHRWLEHHLPIGHRGHWGDPWKPTDRLVIGNPLRFIGMHEVPLVTDQYRRGYLAGLTDSDGTMRYDQTRNRTGQPTPYWRVALQSRDEVAIGRLVAYLSDFGIEASSRPFRGSDDPRHSPMLKVEIRALGRLSELHALVQPSESRDYIRGYLGGFFDGDGSGDSGRITLYNTKSEKLVRLTSYGRSLGFDLRLQLSAGQPAALRLLGGVRESMRFIAAVKPALLRKARLYGVSMQYDPATIKAVESSSTCDVVDIQTSTGTYFAAGHATHNCFAKKGGCGAKWKVGAREIEGQYTGRVENDDVYSLVNTVDKMAQKRALVAASLNLGFSERFTQDMDDIGCGSESTQDPALLDQIIKHVALNDSGKVQALVNGLGKAEKNALWQTFDATQRAEIKKLLSPSDKKLPDNYREAYSVKSEPDQTPTPGTAGDIGADENLQGSTRGYDD